MTRPDLHPVDYPVCLRLAGRAVLVVGGGLVAAQRVAALVEARARVTVIAPDFADALVALADRVTLLHRPFVDGDTRGFALVLVATDHRDVTRRVVAEARASGLWVNAADVPEACDFTLPSVGRRGPIAIAVSTAGEAPALARRIQQAALAAIGRGHVEVARVIGTLRRRLPPGPARMRLLADIATGDIADALIAGERRIAFARLRARLGASR